MMGELKYFLGFQVKQLQEGTFICQTKYTQDILNKFGMKDAKPIKTPMGTSILHPKLWENVLNVLRLANEGALLELLDLKS